MLDGIVKEIPLRKTRSCISPVAQLSALAKNSGGGDGGIGAILRGLAGLASGDVEDLNSSFSHFHRPSSTSLDPNPPQIPQHIIMSLRILRCPVRAHTSALRLPPPPGHRPITLAWPLPMSPNLKFDSKVFAAASRQFVRGTRAADRHLWCSWPEASGDDERSAKRCAGLD